LATRNNLICARVHGCAATIGHFPITGLDICRGTHRRTQSVKWGPQNSFSSMAASNCGLRP
jgi:hypothetical protein